MSGCRMATEARSEIAIRPLTKPDYDDVIRVLDIWWGGPSREIAHPLFLYEFGHHGFAAFDPKEPDSAPIGFLLGFVAEAPQGLVGYVHLVGIDPDYRRKSVGKRLYEHFIAHAKLGGAEQIKAISTVGNSGSVAFHRAMGFEVFEREDYAGPKRARMVYLKRV